MADFIKVTGIDLGMLPAPTPLGLRHHPIGHSAVRESVLESLFQSTLFPEGEGLREEHTLSSDGMQCQMRFLIPYKGHGGLCDYEVGVLNANDQSHSLKLHLSKVVTICANGMVVKDESFSYKRKHTRWLHADLEKRLIEMVESAPSVFEREDNRVEFAQGCDLSQAETDNFICDAYREKVISNRQIGEVFKEYKAPRFEEWGKKQSAYFLENTMTWVQKEQRERNPFEWQKRSLKLNELLVKLLLSKGAHKDEITYLQYGI